MRTARPVSNTPFNISYNFHLKIKWNYKRWMGNQLIDNYINVVIIVKEIERIANQSKIKVVCIDTGESNDSILQNDIETKIGQYVNTNGVLWDSPIKVEDKTSKIIKTPMKDLIKQIEAENIIDL